MSDEVKGVPGVLVEAIGNATEFLLEVCPGDAFRIIRGTDGSNGAVFILKNPEDIADFMELYTEKFSEDVSIPYTSSLDYESN